jgi:hypothetical protein
MQPRRILWAVTVAVAVIWVGNRVYRAHANLVTLSVRNMDVHRVVSKLEWQTWNRIVVNKNVGGKVTLDVHNVPLDEVLNIVSLQTDTRWSRLYPIYSTRKSLTTFNQILRGDLPPTASGWKSLQQLGAWQKNGIGGFANALRAKNDLVSAQFLNKDLSFAAFALSRFSKAEVVPEDGVKDPINLKFQQVPFEKAVAKVAKQAHRKWDRCYALQPLKAATVVKTKAAVPAPAEAAPAEVEVKTIRVDDNKDTNAPERALEAFMATMTPEERQQVEGALAGANQAGGASGGGALQSIQANVAQAAQADVERRIQNRLKYGTVDQRVAHDRQQLPKPQGGPAR